MPHLDRKTLREIVDFSGSSLIDESITERQMEVILKGFNYLVQPENRGLYIADEVGLGKTYIAIGIASLLRHFSASPETYQDVILVPKENLQRKWVKEIGQFLANYYKVDDNIVKSVIGSSVGIQVIHERLRSIERDLPRYHVYRITSFSMSAGSSKKGKLERMLEGLRSDESKEILEGAYRRGYFNVDSELRLKKLYGYLLCMNNPAIELLIVDEAHNFKKGLDDNALDSTHRNNVVARFFGLKRNSVDDKEIFNDFPELRRRIKPRVEKIILLSATPKTTELLEIKRQFECFVAEHPLSGAVTENDVKERLQSFLIRGKLQYIIGKEIKARTSCRYEHRRGNAVKSPVAPPLTIQKDEEALVIGLLQYKTIKDLNQRYGARFEMGMLAGFETFRIDQERKTSNEEEEGQIGEYEEARTRKQKESQDANILREILESYQKTFGTLPPHPKQDAVVRSVFEMMKHGEKSLVFVRRVASAYELERRLLTLWEDMICERLRSYWLPKAPSEALTALVREFDSYQADRLLSEQLDRLLRGVANRIATGGSKYDTSYLKVESDIDREEQLLTGLHYIVSRLDESAELKKLLRIHSHLSTFKTELIDLANRELKKSLAEWESRLEAGGEIYAEDKEIDDSRYFITLYFNRQHMKSWKRKMYDKNWFDINFFLINREFKLAGYDAEKLTKKQIGARNSGNFREVQEIFLKSLNGKPYKDGITDLNAFPASLARTTLLTELLLRDCRPQIDEFIRERQTRGVKIFPDLRKLVTILRSTLRNGAGLLPLFIADQSRKKTEEIYLEILRDPTGGFDMVLKEVQAIVRDFQLICAVNFPPDDDATKIERKLTFQSPAKGITGQQRNNKEKVATQFRMPGFPYALICSDIFREGEDLHTYCQNVFHYGIAWNSSDMEQRNGRIDRINSLSHRRLRSDNELTFENRLHVFYPYIQQTLEVNQVARLFDSINAFVQAFDIVDSLNEDGQASTADAVEKIPTIFRGATESRFEHMFFKGHMFSAPRLKRQPPIGATADELSQFIGQIVHEVGEWGEFHLEPRVEMKYSLIGDFRLTNRNGRRGPFRVRILGSDVPGRFMVEVASYLFSVTHWNQFVMDKYPLANMEPIPIDEYLGLRFVIEAQPFDWKKFRVELNKLVDMADEIELQETREDLKVFE